MPHPEAIAHFPKSMQMFIKRIHNRIDSGKNCLVAVVGPTGSGKSFSTLTIMVGLDLYRYGKIKPIEWYMAHCIFRASDLMKGLNDPNLEKKAIWMWDEAGVDAGTAEHATVKNKVIGWLAQTFRNLQQVVFFTLPTLGMLTPQVRKLLHIYLESLSVDKSRNMCIMKPLEIQYNIRMDKIYYHNLKVLTQDGYMEEIDIMGVPKAPDQLIDEYEKKKSLFTQDLNLQIQGMLEVIERKAKNDPVDRYTDLQKAIHEAIVKHNVVTITEIAEFCHSNPPLVSQNLNYMRNKGGNYPQITRKKPVIKVFRQNSPPISNIKAEQIEK